MKFTDFAYKRVTPDALAPQMSALVERLKSASDFAEALRVFYEFETLNDELSTQATLAQIHFSLNTEDPFWVGENDYYDEVMPEFTKLLQDFYKTLLESPFKKDFSAELGALLIQNLELELTTFSEAIMPFLQEENRLTTAYAKLLAGARIEFDGKVLNLSQMTPYEQSTNRLVRRNACETKAEFFEENAETLDQIFDELVHVRDEMAKTLGFPSFVEMAYARLGRNCYSKTEVTAFRHHIQKQLVPLVSKLKDRQAARIGLETLMSYDNPLLFPDGNACPKGTPEEIFAHGKTMYAELSPETSEFFDFMLEHDLMDVLTRRGKSGGGFCTFLPEHKAPYIFANFNGTSHDIDVLTHEAGHAFAAYLAKDMPVSELRNPTMESCEIHSMSMEFFTWPWMEGFFREQTDKYRFAHLSEALTFIPYGAMVDAFQQKVYEEPQLTPRERRDYWLALESEFRPYIDWSGVPFYESGGRWQAQMHIYEVPFYYIDYCLAQTVALTFWADMQKDRPSAWRRYMALLQAAGTKTFTELLSLAEISSPFEEQTLTRVAGAASAWLFSEQSGALTGSEVALT